MLLRICTLTFLSLGIVALPSRPLHAQGPGGPPGASRAQSVLNQAASEGKFTFLIFFKQNDPATSAMSAKLQQTLANHADKSVVTFVKVDDLAERALVAKYDVGRAPMPMALAIAPNGAMTGMFGAKVTAELIQNAFVTPTMMAAMKALQEGKLVVVTVRGSAVTASPLAVRELQSDPHFGPRMVSLAMSAADPDEAMFLGQMKIDARTTTTKLTVLAPPGVMVGQFDATASKGEIAGALANAGKCCDDPNCKHHQSSTRATPPPPQGARK